MRANSKPPPVCSWCTARPVACASPRPGARSSTRDRFGEIERSFAGVNDLAALPSGLLRVTAPVALGRQQILRLIPAFLARYPAVRLELELSDRVASLAREGFDLAIRHASEVPETHGAWTLCETRSMLVATRGYLGRRGTPTVPAELAAHDCLFYLRSGNAPTWSFEQTRGRKLRHSVPVQGSFAANNNEALREAALGGVGIAMVPDFSTKAEMGNGKLVHVLPDWQPVGAFGSTCMPSGRTAPTCRARCGPS